MSIKSIKQIYDFTKMNEGNIYVGDKYKGVYRLGSNNSIDDIELPESLEINPKGTRYDDGEGLQLQIVDKKTKKLVGVLNCKKTHEDLKQLEIARQKRSEALLKEELENAKKMEEEQKIREKNSAKWQIARQKYYDNYIEYLLEHNASKDIIELEGIKNLMMELIDHADRVNLANGRTPFSYPEVREDGTFDIKARLNGFAPDVIYKISYTDDTSEDKYLKIDKTSLDPTGFEEPKTTTFFVNKDGEIIDPHKKPHLK